MLVITAESHLDHALTLDHIQFILSRYENKEEFFIETVELPLYLDSLPCCLHGPLVGDDPVEEDEVFYEKRGNREYESRLCRRDGRKSHQMTVIAGPDRNGNACVLYTAFGGPLAPREPGDPSLEGDKESLEKSRAFWAQHALSIP